MSLTHYLRDHYVAYNEGGRTFIISYDRSHAGDMFQVFTPNQWEAAYNETAP